MDKITGTLFENSIGGNIDNGELSGQVRAASSLEGSLRPSGVVGGVLQGEGDLWGEILNPTTVYMRDYNVLDNKPSINGVTLIADKSIEELGVNPMSNLEILDIFNRVFRRD